MMNAPRKKEVKGLNSCISGFVVGFVSLDGMVEDAFHGYIVRSSFMDLSSGLFTGIPML